MIMFERTSLQSSCVETLVKPGTTGKVIMKTCEAPSVITLSKPANHEGKDYLIYSALISKVEACMAVITCHCSVYLM